MKPAPRAANAVTRAAGAVVFRRSERGIQLLLLRAYRNWDFPKGLVEPGENELDAAKREVHEETGLAGLHYPYGEEFKETLPYAGAKVARYYLAQTDADKIDLPVSPELGRPEHYKLHAFITPFAALFGLALWTLVLHLFALFLAPERRGLNSTARVLCYAAGPAVFSVVPLLGPFVAAIWGFVLQVFGLREAHRTTTSRAVAIVLLPLALLVLFVFSVIVLAVLVLGVTLFGR